MRLPVKDPAEKKTVEFDFSAEVPDVATLSSPVVTCVVSLGVDASAAAMVTGAATVSGHSVFQMIQAGVDGNEYTLRCQATDSTGQIHVIQTTMPVRA